MMKLGGLFHPTGNHIAAWMHPDAQIDAGSNFQHYVRLAKTAEAARFDLLFFADAAAVRGGNLEALSRWPQYMAYFEPTTLLAGIAATTHNIGLIATATTSYNEPYNIARRYASLDHISAGRAGWNVVTSSNLDESLNFGREEHFSHEHRYERAREFVGVVRGLWDSWQDDAFIRDRETGVYFQPDGLHTLDHRGKHFSVRGPLNISRPPQGHPVIAQAGSSNDGMELAAETAEIVFTAQHSMEKAKAFYDDLKGRMSRYGRDPSQLKIMPGLNPVIGASRSEAQDRHARLQAMIQPEVGLELLSNALGGYDLSGADLDGPLPDTIRPDDTNTSKSTVQSVLDMAKRESLTIRQLYQKLAGARGQRTIVGTPGDIADEMEAWFRAEAVDGFLVQPPVLPGDLDEFCATVIPELQKRGIFRTEYEGATLRENLGLNRPHNRFSTRTSK
jgi:alkanesulfonate monooxygenase